jgi:hypothetical protein
MDQRLERLLNLLDAVADDSGGTSVRLPTHLRDGAAAAVERGMAASTTELS